MELGPLLKKIRSDRKLTLSEVASAVDLTPSSLSQIENGKISPSISTLEAVLAFYRLPVSDFFRQIEQTDIIVAKKGDLESIEASQGVMVSLLASKLAHNTLESYSVVIQPSGELRTRELPPEKNGERFLFVGKGTVSVIIGERTYSAENGDSLNFKSHLPCTIRNETGVSAEFFINGTPPIL